MSPADQLQGSVTVAVVPERGYTPGHGEASGGTGCVRSSALVPGVFSPTRFLQASPSLRGRRAISRCSAIDEGKFLALDQGIDRTPEFAVLDCVGV